MVDVLYLMYLDLIYFSVINGEKAAFNSQVFAEKRTRTIDLSIKDMYMEYLKDVHKVGLKQVPVQVPD